MRVSASIKQYIKDELTKKSEDIHTKLKETIAEREKRNERFLNECKVLFNSAIEQACTNFDSVTKKYVPGDLDAKLVLRYSSNPSLKEGLIEELQNCATRYLDVNDPELEKLQEKDRRWDGHLANIVMAIVGQLELKKIKAEDIDNLIDEYVRTLV